VPTRGVSTVTFTVVTAAAGINFVHHNSAFGKQGLLAALSSGGATVDPDRDAW